MPSFYSPFLLDLINLLSLLLRSRPRTMDGTKREHKSEAGIPKKTIMYIHKYAVAGPTDTPTIKTNKADNPIRIKMISTLNKYNKTADNHQRNLRFIRKLQSQLVND